MHGILIVAPLVLVMAMGWVARRRGLIREESVSQFNDLLYWIGLPALLFRSTLSVGKDAFSSPNLFFAVHLAFIVTPALAWVLASLYQKDRKRRAVSILVSVRSNNVYMGIPAIALAMGEPGTRALGLFFAVCMVGYHLVTLTWAQVAISGGVNRDSLKKTLAGLAKNPLLLACLAGLALAGLGLRAAGRHRLGQGARCDLPGDAPAILAPAAGALGPAVADDGVPVAVGLFLVVGGDLERERFILLEGRAAVQADAGDARHRELDGQHVAFLA